MSTVAYDASEPQPSGEFQAADPERADDIERKHQRIAEFLKSKPYDALLLQDPANFAWFTSGAKCPQVGPSETIAALLITPDSRVVVSNNVDSGELFDKELSGLGFLLKQRPWYEARHVLLDDLCRGRGVASDTGFGGTVNESAMLDALRVSLEPVECVRLRQLGRLVARAIEATCRTIELGQTEAEIAGHLAHRLIRQEVSPLRMQVVADGKGRQYRHWSHGAVELRKWCTISAVATRWGLCCGAARTVCFGNPSDELAAAYQKTAMLEATGFYFSRTNCLLSIALEKVRRIYEKVGHADEWQLCDQGCVIGYRQCEALLVPRSDFLIGPRMAIYWHPSIGPVQVGDTILVGDAGAELITPHDQWPTFRVAVKGTPLTLPDLLRREAAEQNGQAAVTLRMP